MQEACMIVLPWGVLTGIVFLSFMAGAVAEEIALKHEQRGRNT
jgi:hypothetical protein